MPDLRFKEFAHILKGPPNPPATSYDVVWKFEDLFAWIRKKIPALCDQRIICLTEMRFRDEDYSDILGCKHNEKLNHIISDQSSWVATVMAAQINRPKPEAFLGFPIFACLETDARAPEHDKTDSCAPEHDEADVIVPHTGTVEWAQGTLSRSGKEDKELGKRLEIKEGVGPGKGNSG